MPHKALKLLSIYSFFPSHDPTRLSVRVSGLSGVLCFVAGRVDTDVSKVVLHSSSGSHSPREVLLDPDSELLVQRHGVITYRTILYLQYAVTDALSSGPMYTHETQTTRTLAANDTLCVTQFLSVSCVINN